MESCKISEQNGINQFLDFTLEAINNKGESNDKKSMVISSVNANMWDQQCAISSRECDEEYQKGEDVEEEDLIARQCAQLSIPTEGLELCLARLPIRSIAIARTVCKTWFALLSFPPHSLSSAIISHSLLTFCSPLLNKQCPLTSQGESSPSVVPSNPSPSPLRHSNSVEDLERIPFLLHASSCLASTSSPFSQPLILNQSFSSRDESSISSAISPCASFFPTSQSPLSHSPAYISPRNSPISLFSESSTPHSQGGSFLSCISVSPNSSSPHSSNPTIDISPDLSFHNLAARPHGLSPRHLSFQKSSSSFITSPVQSSTHVSFVDLLVPSSQPVEHSSPLAPSSCSLLHSLASSSVYCTPSLHLPPHLVSLRKSVGAQEPWLFVLGWLPLHTDRRKAIIQAYDPSFNCWHSRPAEILHGRSFYSVVAAGGLIYVLGGCHEINTPQATVLVYNPLTNIWKEASPMLHPRSKPAAGVFRYTFKSRTLYEHKEQGCLHHHFGEGTQKIIVAGGEGGICEQLQSAEIYDPETDSWEEIESLPLDYKGVEGHAAVCNGKFFVCSQPTKIAAYDLRRGTWSKIHVLHGTPYPHGWGGNFRLVACEGHSLLMVGVPWGPEGQKSMKMWKFQEATLQWLELASPQSSGVWSNEEIWSCYAAAGKQELYVFSLSESPGFLGAVCVFSPKGMKWHQVAHMQDRGPPRKLAVVVPL